MRSHDEVVHSDTDEVDDAPVEEESHSDKARFDEEEADDGPIKVESHVEKEAYVENHATVTEGKHVHVDMEELAETASTMLDNIVERMDQKSWLSDSVLRY